MARRSYYPSSAGGFADGFTQGFGLVQNQYNTEREMALEERRLSEAAARDQRQFEATQARLDRDYGLAVKAFDADAKENAAAAEARRRTEEFQQDITRQETAINATKAQAELARLEGINAEATRAEEQAERERRQNEAIQAITNLEIMRNAPVGTYTTEDIMREIKATEGTPLDVLRFLSEDTQQKIANLSSTIGAGLNAGNLDLNNQAILDGLTSMFDSERGRLIGKTVDESFVNAPDAYKDGNYEVINRQVVSARQDANDPRLLNADVSVVLKHKDTGDVVYYDAPLTVGRSADSERAAVPIEEAISGIAGVSMLIQELENKRPLIESALIKSRFENDQQFTAAVDAEMSRLEQQKATPDSRRILAGTPNENLTSDQLRSVARSNVLGIRDQSPDFSSDRRRQIARAKDQLKAVLARASMPSKDADGNNVSSPFVFSDSQILRLASVMDGRTISSTVTDMARNMVENAGGDFAEPRAEKVDRRGRTSPVAIKP
jgi:hypothetical protein